MQERIELWQIIQLQPEEDFDFFIQFEYLRMV